MDVHPAVTMLLAVQKMKFCLCTERSDSKSCCGGGKDGTPFQGVRRGNRAGPATCVAVFVVLVLAFCARGHAAQIRSALSQARIILAGLIFVGDADLKPAAQRKSVFQVRFRTTKFTERCA